MTVSLSDEKFDKLYQLAQRILELENVSIRLVASLMGIMVSFCPGIEYGQLYYRQIEIEKTIALKRARGDFDKNMILSHKAKNDIKWWLAHAKNSKRKISHGNATIILYTDASNQGWGATTSQENTGGRWSPEEQLMHINTSELLAIQFGLQSFFNDCRHSHIKVFTDNTTAVSYLRNMGGSHSTLCNDISWEIWLWCKVRDLWLTVAHIPGSENTIADKASRIFNDASEWQLDKTCFDNLAKMFGYPDIDMFSSRLNFQVKCYVFWEPDPNAYAVDAFTLDWGEYFSYMFPPFRVIPQVLQKIEEEQAKVFLIVPQWETQAWYPKLARMLVAKPVLLPQSSNIVNLPFNPAKKHPLWKKLRLMGCLLSGNPWQTKAFRTELKKSCLTHGDQVQESSTTFISGSGTSLQVD
ncbi:uncharacterized protein [Montipora foliosa]|uniref:uncharacterized protein n=1 Tax=Montipora foliosa TaxID=591990 RepID=UPI0035F17DFF